MRTVTLNGQTVELAEGATIADVVAANSPSDRGIAVALDLEIVPRSEWPTRPIPDGSALEIVTAAPGG